MNFEERTYILFVMYSVGKIQVLNYGNHPNARGFSSTYRESIASSKEADV